ncbi:MAG: addiction module protein [Propionibacteriaceae bacterium]|jgi:putative addiction module component (TIGR02574 family)|nr:addiction module protein [Propionibacteriaceae bacterium]
MVNAALRRKLDALTLEERADAADYLLRSMDPQDFALTAEQEQLVAHRVAEIKADPSIGVTSVEMRARFEAKWA